LEPKVNQKWEDTPRIPVLHRTVLFNLASLFVSETPLHGYTIFGGENKQALVAATGGEAAYFEKRKMLRTDNIGACSSGPVVLPRVVAFSFSK
jgi:hypothetical protein